jgi:predicted peroxiredoxin
MIWVHSGLGNDINQDSLLSQIFREAELKTTIDNKYFREDGTKIYLCESPTEGFKNWYNSRINELMNRYR